MKLKQSVKDSIEWIAIITFIVAFISVAMVGMKYSARNFDKRLAEQKKTDTSTYISQK